VSADGWLAVDGAAAVMSGIPEPQGEIAVSGRLEVLSVDNGTVALRWTSRSGSTQTFALAARDEVVLTITTQLFGEPNR
jgi:hypothetical protein